MGLKFRRGTNAQKSGSLAFGEPYVNTDLGTLQIGGATGDITLGASGTGSQGTFSGISGSSLDITGNAKIDGNLTLGGNITIGDQTSDTVSVVASLSSSLYPSTTNAFDLGSATKIWRDLYISTGSIKFVAGTTVVKELNLATLTALETATGSANASITSLNSYTSSNDTTNTAQSTRLTTIESVTGSYETKGRSIVSGSSQITYASISSIPAGIVSGSSQVTGIGNAQLTNSSTTIGTTAIALGASSTTLAGLTSVSSTGFTGALTGNASTATTLATARTINGTSFDGGSNITIPNLVSGSAQIDGSLLGSNKTITIGSTSTTLGGTSTTLAGLTSVTSTTFVGALTGNASTVTTNANLTGNVTSVGNATTIASGVVTSDMIVDGTIVNGDINASAAIVDTKLATIATAGKVSNSATTATNANTANAIVARDGSGNFSAGTITAALTGNASTATTAGTVTTAAQSAITSVGTLTSLTVSGATATGALTVTGAVTATGDITAFFTSDKRHKNNIQTIPNALEKVTKLNGVTWEWNDDVNEVTKSTPKTGLIAQEVQEVLPEVVKTRDDGFLALDYSKMMGLLVEAIKEQQIQIEELKAQIGSK